MAKASKDPEAQSMIERLAEVLVHNFSERPHPELATEAEAREIGQDLIDTGTVDAKIIVRQARPGEGMPAPQGDMRPLLMCWMDVDPVSVQPVQFCCSVGELARAVAYSPGGAWRKDYEARTVRRERR